MPRKTNKTAHVLSLLANGIPTESEPEEDNTKLAPNISIIDSPTSPADPLAGLIRNSLDEEIKRITEIPPAIDTDHPVIADSEPALDEFSAAEPESVSEAVPMEEASSAPELLPSEENISEDEPSYISMNMMDTLLTERLMEFMHRFDACTCDRCIQDVRALTLTNLPPKYVVLPKSSLSPMTNFYRNKFNIYIVTELTKACLAVLNNPHH